MITLVNATRVHQTATGPVVVLAGASAVFRPGARVGILAAAGSGKSTLARLLCGIDQPDGGAVLRQGRVSWPMGFAGGFHPDLSGATNIRLLADMMGQDPDAALAFCGLFGGLGDRMGHPVKGLTPVERATLAFSFSLALPCDTYVADEVLGVGDTLMRRKCDAMLDRRLQTAGLIFLSRNPAQIKKYCQTTYALIRGKLIACPDVDVAATMLGLTGPMQPDLAAEVPE